MCIILYYYYINMAEHNNFTPFKMYDAKNLMLILSFFSPFIVIFYFTFMGMYFSPFTGLLFLFSILITIAFRTLLYKKILTTSLIDNDSNVCNLINYSGIGTGDIYLSLWVFSFTLFYIIIPLVTKNGIQTSLITFLVLFILLFVGDIIAKSINGCYKLTGKKPINILFNIIIGGILGVFLSLGYSINSKMHKYLFFIRKSSNEKCEQVNDTKFQCSFDYI